MKTERRHELETNVLADWLGRQLRRARPYANAMLAGVFGLMAVIVIWMVWSNQSGKRASEGWDAYIVATDGLSFGFADGERLKEIARDFSGTKVADWSSLAAADEQLRFGANVILRDKEQGFRYLNEAVDAYKKIQQTAKLEAVRNLATFGMAQAYEMLGKLDQAIEAFGEVQGVLAAQAQKRAEALKENERIGEFYDWFVVASLPERTFSTGPGTPGERPEFDLNTPADLEDLLNRFKEQGSAKDDDRYDGGKDGGKDGASNETPDDSSPLEGLFPQDEFESPKDEGFPDSVVPPDPTPPGDND